MAELMDDRVYTVIRIETLGNGCAVGRYETNDDDDDGVPGPVETYDIHYGSVEQALKLCGKSRTGIWGHQVTVYLDGRKI